MKKFNNLLAVLIIGLISIGCFSPCMAASPKKDKVKKEKVKKVRVKYIPDLEVNVPIPDDDVFLQLAEDEFFCPHDYTHHLKSYIVSRQAIWRLKTRYIKYRGDVPYAKSGAEANMSEELYDAVCRYHQGKYMRIGTFKIKRLDAVK